MTNRHVSQRVQLQDLNATKNKQYFYRLDLKIKTFTGLCNTQKCHVHKYTSEKIKVNQIYWSLLINRVQLLKETNLLNKVSKVSLQSLERYIQDKKTKTEITRSV